MHRTLLFIASALIVGCASSKESARRGEESDVVGISALMAMPDDSAVAAVRHLEADPLGTEAKVLRQRLVEWVLAAESLGSFDGSTAPIDDLESSSYRYKDELMMQFLFGSAVWRLNAGARREDLTAQQEAGIRSMIAAYRNIMQADAGLRDPFLDRLDDLRRRDELRGYIERNRGGR